MTREETLKIVVALGFVERHRLDRSEQETWDDAKAAASVELAKADVTEAEGRRKSAEPRNLHREVAELLNRHCAENGSNTPDFILAEYLLGCLGAFNHAVNAREQWYGRGEVTTAQTSAMDFQPLPKEPSNGNG